MADADSLEGQPVVIGSVHSHLLPAVAGVKARRPDARIAYVMTDGGALPASWSATVARLKGRGEICGCVTSGHAFGGDLEAVNIYSALLAARHVLAADVTVVAMGPGVVGVGTPFGHTGLEVAPRRGRDRGVGRASPSSFLVSAARTGAAVTGASATTPSPL